MQFNAKIAILRSNGHQFQNHTLHEFLFSKGIVLQSSCAYTPRQNRVAERKNRHLVARSLILSTSLPSYLWGDVRTAIHQSDALSCSPPPNPLECLKESYPSTRLIPEVPLRVLGCTTYVHSHGPNQTKFTHRAQACGFVGYPPHQQGYKCFHPSSHEYFISMDVTFLEDHPFFLLGPLQGVCVSEEPNCVIRFESTNPTLLTLPYLDSHNTVLPTNQVP